MDWEARGKVISLRGEKPRWQDWANNQLKLLRMLRLMSWLLNTS
jgi:hypothetical protein